MTPDEISNAFPTSPASEVENPAVDPAPPSMSPIEQPQTVETPPPPSKSNKKIILIIGIVILLLVLVAVGVFAFMKKQTPKMREDENFPTPMPTQEAVEDEMSGWETYVDDELQISFKYPTDWEKLTENNNRIEFTDSAIVKDLPAGIVNQEYCTRERDCYPVARIKLSIVENESEGVISNQKLSQTLINGLPAKSYYYSKEAPYPYATYFTLPNETILLVEAWVPSQTNCQGECPVYEDSEGIIQVGKEIEQILTTFQFTN